MGEVGPVANDLLRLSPQRGGYISQLLTLGAEPARFTDQIRHLTRPAFIFVNDMIRHWFAS
jgi:hypothetical protein